MLLSSFRFIFFIKLESEINPNKAPYKPIKAPNEPKIKPNEPKKEIMFYQQKVSLIDTTTLNKYQITQHSNQTHTSIYKCLYPNKKEQLKDVNQIIQQETLRRLISLTRPVIFLLVFFFFFFLKLYLKVTLN